MSQVSVLAKACYDCRAPTSGVILVCPTCAETRVARDGVHFLRILCAQIEAENPGVDLAERKKKADGKESKTERKRREKPAWGKGVHGWDE